MALTGNKRSLFGVTGIALLDCHNDHETLSRGRQIDAADIRDARPLHGVPNGSGAKTGPVHAVNSRLKGRSAADDRIIAIVESLDPNERLGPLRARVITRPFPKGTFRQTLTGGDLALDGNLRASRNMELRQRRFHDLDRLAQDTTGPVVLVDPERYRLRCRYKQERMLAEHHRNGKGLARAH